MISATQSSLKSRDRRDGLLCATVGVILVSLYFVVSGESSVLLAPFNGEAPYVLLALAALFVYALLASPSAATKSRSPARAMGGVLFALGALGVTYVGLLAAAVLHSGSLQPGAFVMLAGLVWLLGAIPAILLGFVFTALSRRPHRS